VTFLEIHIEPRGDDPYGQIEMAFIRVKRPLVFCKLVVKIDEYQGMYLDGIVKCMIFIDKGEARDGDMLYCCPLIIGKYSGATDLLLKPTYVKGQYTRFGYFVIQDRQRTPRLFKQFCSISPIDIDAPPELYEKIAAPTTDGLAQYIFRVV
jgi:hypothetical protein